MFTFWVFNFLAIILISPSHLSGSLAEGVPEVPSFFSLLFHGKDTPVAQFLREWETVFFSILSALFISVIFCLGARYKELLPQRFQNLVEYIVEAFQKFAMELIGPEGKKFVPFLGTLFIYILTMNWLAVVPLVPPPSSNLSVTAALAICVFAFVQFLSIKNFGFFGYLHHLSGSPKGVGEWLMVPLMFPIELLTQLSRPLTLAFRLFGNVLGEDILIGTFALFGVTLFAASQFPIALPLQLPFMFFAMLTGVMQALVFTLLSAIYILLAMPSKESFEFVTER
ncbi:MAG: F0F1 ATP synthase subunit A [Parachlamydiaceae bacterium]|nr:F0F1 ATP synthase subunit A [Parachlamydiaceae bacterium]